MAEKVDILIMAAGGSRRFGSCKLLADFRGAPLLTYALNTATTISHSHPELISSVNVVLGGYADEIGNFVKGRRDRVGVFRCPDWEMGLGHSLAFGVAQLPVENAVLIMLADQPLIDVADIYGLLRSAEQNPGKMICAEFSSTLGVPAIFPADMKKTLMQLQGDKGAKSVLVGAGERLVAIPIPGAALDIDWPDNLTRYLK